MEDLKSHSEIELFCKKKNISMSRFAGELISSAWEGYKLTAEYRRMK
jgi:hypothetical protein